MNRGLQGFRFPAEAVMGGWVESGWNGGAHRRRCIANLAGWPRSDLQKALASVEQDGMLGGESKKRRVCALPNRGAVRGEKMGRTHKTQAGRPNMRFIYPHFTRKFAGCDHGG